MAIARVEVQRSDAVTVGCACTGGTHHSFGAPRGQSTATRTRAEERETYSAPRRQEPPLPAVTTGTQYFTMDDESVPVTGLRPTCLVEPRGPQERVQRHTMEHITDLVRVAPMVQILDAPVPQMVDKLEDVLKIVDLSVPVQEIEVPKISSLSCPPLRCFLPDERNSWWKCRPCCLPPGSRSRSSTLQFLRVVASGVSKVFSQYRVQQRRFLLQDAFLSGLWSSSSTFLLLVVALGRVRPHLLVLQMRILLGFSALFPMEKSAGCRAGGECATGWARQLIHAERSSNAQCRRARGLWRFRRVGQVA